MSEISQAPESQNHIVLVCSTPNKDALVIEGTVASVNEDVITVNVSSHQEYDKICIGEFRHWKGEYLTVIDWEDSRKIGELSLWHIF